MRATMKLATDRLLAMMQESVREGSSTWRKDFPTLRDPAKFTELFCAWWRELRADPFLSAEVNRLASDGLCKLGQNKNPVTDESGGFFLRLTAGDYADDEAAQQRAFCFATAGAESLPDESRLQWIQNAKDTVIPGTLEEVVRRASSRGGVFTCLFESMIAGLEWIKARDEDRTYTVHSGNGGTVDDKSPIPEIAVASMTPAGPNGTPAELTIGANALNAASSRDWIDRLRSSLASFPADRPIGTSGLAYMPIAKDPDSAGPDESCVRVSNPSPCWTIKEEILRHVETSCSFQQQTEFNRDFPERRLKSVRDLRFALAWLESRIVNAPADSDNSTGTSPAAPIAVTTTSPTDPPSSVETVGGETGAKGTPVETSVVEDNLAKYQDPLTPLGKRIVAALWNRIFAVQFNTLRKEAWKGSEVSDSGIQRRLKDIEKRWTEAELNDIDLVISAATTSVKLVKPTSKTGDKKGDN